jgi:hypothetical protein
MDRRSSVVTARAESHAFETCYRSLVARAVATLQRTGLAPAAQDLHDFLDDMAKHDSRATPGAPLRRCRRTAIARARSLVELVAERMEDPWVETRRGRIIRADAMPDVMWYAAPWKRNARARQIHMIDAAVLLPDPRELELVCWTYTSFATARDSILRGLARGIAAEGARLVFSTMTVGVLQLDRREVVEFEVTRAVIEEFVRERA